MSVPPIDPLGRSSFPVGGVDPRFRYGQRAIPQNFPQATSRFYLPNQRDSRFWPLYYDSYEKEQNCTDVLTSKEPPICVTDQDCVGLVSSSCTDGEARDISYKCVAKATGKGYCQYSFLHQ